MSADGLPALPVRSLLGTILRAAVLFVVALMFFAPSVYKFALDEAQWLLMAENVVRGYGLVDVSGNYNWYRVGYVLYYALSYLVGGVSGAALAPFIGLAAFTVLLFMAAQRLYGPPTAALAVALYVLNPRQRYLTAQLIDGVCAATVLVAFLLMTSERKQNEFWPGVVAGLVCFVAFLIKEIAILILPLPLLLALMRCNFATRERIAGFYLSAATLLGVYGLTVALTFESADPYFRSDDLSLQQFSFLPETGAIVTRIAQGAANAIAGLAYYFYHPTHFSSLYRFMGIIVLLPIALVVSAVGAFHGNRSDRAVLTVIALFLPLMAVTGWLDWRPEQALVAIGFFHVLIARMIVDAAAFFVWPRPVFAAAAVLLAFVVLLQDTRNEHYYWSLGNSQIGRLLEGEPPGIDSGFKGTAELWNDLASLVGQDQKLWSSPTIAGISGTLGSGVRFRTAAVPVHVLGMPGVVSGYVKPGPTTVRGNIWGVYALTPISGDAPLFILYSDDLRKGRNNTSLVLLAPLSVNWPWLEPMQPMLAGTLLRPARSLDTDDFGPVRLLQWDAELYARNIDRQFVHEDALRQLKLLRQDFPDRFAWYLARLREGGLDLSENLLDRLLAGAKEQSITIIREVAQ